MRRKVTAELEKWRSREDRKSLLIKGARQIGKTYSILDFAEKNYRNVVYFDFNTDETASKAFDGPLDVDSILLGLSSIRPDTSFEPYETVIILDEIQLCPRARSSLKAFSQDPRYDVIASGSLLGLELSKVPLVPVGYVDHMDMYPMDFEEFLWAMNINENVIAHIKDRITLREPIGKAVHDSMMSYFSWYMLVGGMPLPVLNFSKQRTFDDVRQAQNNIMQDYRDDVNKYCEEKEVLRTKRCFDSLEHQLAKDNRKFTISAIEPELSYRPSSERYEYAIDWLIQAGLVLPCYRVSNPNMPAEETVIGRRDQYRIDDAEDTVGEYLFKLYVFDCGLLAYMHDPSIYREVISGNREYNRGSLVENAVACMLNTQGRKLLYYEKTREMEIDFILVIGGHSTAVEVKSGRNRSCRSLNKAMGRFGMKGMMLDDTDIFTDDKGVEHLPLYAAAFMDCVDPPKKIEIDFDSIDRLNAEFAER